MSVWVTKTAQSLVLIMPNYARVERIIQIVETNHDLLFQQNKTLNDLLRAVRINDGLWGANIWRRPRKETDNPRLEMKQMVKLQWKDLSALLEFQRGNKLLLSLLV